MNDLQQIAAEYASHGLAVIPGLPASKEAAISWKLFQYHAPTQLERDAMFSNTNCNLNIAVVCGSVSQNLAMIDAETPEAFEAQLRHCDRAGLLNTWVDRSPRGGGHIALRFPVAVKPLAKQNDVEVRAQGQYVLMPPSVWFNQDKGVEAPYEILQRTDSILEVSSLDAVHWLKLEPAAPRLPYRSLPRAVRELLSGKNRRNYVSRSETEQAIIDGLVNAGFNFEEVLSLFRQYPAAGKFRELDSEDTQRAVDWLRLSFDQARSWCIQMSPGRKFAADVFSGVGAMPWPGRTGSADRAVYIAHTGIAYRSGKIVYHASTRDLGELAGCSRVTAARATRRLLLKGFIEQKQSSAFTFAAKYQLTERTNIDPLPHNGFKGVVQTSSFLLPEAFRHRGLGRSGYEVLNALETGPLTAKEISERTGRHIQTVRAALKRLRKVGLAVKTAKKWCGRGLEDVNLDDLARAVGMKGALQLQRERHSADRLRHKMSVIREQEIEE